MERVVAPGSGTAFEVWDLGGQASLRPSWAAYYKATDAVIMVVDSTDRARAGVAKGELFSLLADAHTRGAPLLVVANKQDVAGAMGVPELTAALSLHSVQRHDWHVQPACATKGDGLVEGLEWVAARLKGGPVPVATPPPPPPPPPLPSRQAPRRGPRPGRRLGPELRGSSAAAPGGGGEGERGMW